MQITDLLNKNEYFIDGKISFKSKDAQGNDIKEIEYVEVIATKNEVDKHGEIVDFSCLNVDDFKGIDCKIEHKAYKTVGVIDSDNINKTENQVTVGIYLNKKSRYYKEANQGLLDGTLTGASIGSLVQKVGNTLKTKQLLEVSLVGDPAVYGANVLSYKSDDNFLSTLKPAPLNYKSSYAESLERVKKYYNAINEPNEDFKKCFIIKSESNNFDSLALLAVDIINGKPMLLTKKCMSYIDTLEQINSENVKNIEKDLTIIKNKHQELIDQEKIAVKSEIEMIKDNGSCKKFLRKTKSYFNEVLSRSDIERLVDLVVKTGADPEVGNTTNELVEKSEVSDNSTNSSSQVYEKKTNFLTKLAEKKKANQ